MQIETPPSSKPYEKPEGERRGLVLVNTGDGKGKSAAAFGLALRAHGRAKAVKIWQFTTVPNERAGEHRMFAQLGIPIEGLGDGFGRDSQDNHDSRDSQDGQHSHDAAHSARLACDGWRKAKASILSGDFFLVVLDKIADPLIDGWLPLDEVLLTLRERPKHVHVVLTGRRMPPELIALADTVTEMQNVRHASGAGTPAPHGIGG